MQWDKIMEAAKRLENLLRRADVDFNEAQKAIGYYLFKGCDDYRDGTIPQRDGGEPAPAQQAHTGLLQEDTPHLATVESQVWANWHR
jgi:dsDNA-binding SOS-regulon protein